MDLYLELVQVLSLGLYFFDLLFVVVEDVIIECLELALLLLYDLPQ